MMRLKPKALATAIISALIFTGCGGGGSDSEDNNSVYLNTSQEDYGRDLITRNTVTLVTRRITSLTADHGTVEKISEDDPSSTKAQWLYTFDRTYYQNHEVPLNFVETFNIVTDEGEILTKDLSFSPKDELMQYSWHLYNDGQAGQKLGCSTNCPSIEKGFDLDILDAWNTKDNTERNITGQGVTVAVLDTPVDIAHPDLKNNVFKPKFSGNTTINTEVINKGLTTLDLAFLQSPLHGTKVAGIIAASGENGGIRGEAFNSKFFSVPIFYFGSDSEQIKHDVYKALFQSDTMPDVINESFNFYSAAFPDDTLKTYLDSLYESGTPIVKASGNDYLQTKGFLEAGPSFSTSGYRICTSYDTDCTFAQTSEEYSSAGTIVVGAVSANAEHTFYSSTGPQLWISGFSGEYGLNSTTRTQPAIPSTASHLTCDKLPTTDIAGSKIIDDNVDSKWRTIIEPTCRYTSSFNGTSAAAPVVTGVVALLKQVDTNFTVPQIKYILAQSASNDYKWPTLSYIPKTARDESGNSIITDASWQNNSAGMRFSNTYGFGVVNANEAVKLALNCQSDAGCALRNEQPLDVVSTSTPDCVLLDQTKGLYECTFTNLKELTPSGKKVELTGPLEVESTRVNIYGLKQKFEASPIDKHCVYSEPDADSAYNTDYNYYYYAMTRLAMNLSSPNSADRVLKPYMAYWYYDRSFFENLDSKEYYIQSNAFYREHIMPSDTWKLTIKSRCAIDVNSLNESIHLLLKAYPVSL